MAVVSNVCRGFRGQARMVCSGLARPEHQASTLLSAGGHWVRTALVFERRLDSCPVQPAYFAVPAGHPEKQVGYSLGRAE